MSCKPGFFSDQFVSGSVGKAPDVRLAIAYQDLRSKWMYQPDPPGLDKFANAECIFESERFIGDCEDFASALAALSQSLRLTCHLALGEIGQTGHAWLEVCISESEFDADLSFRLESIFGDSTSIVNREDGVWMQLSPEGSLHSFMVSHFIETSGELIKL